MNVPVRTEKKIPLIFAMALVLLWIAPGLMGRDLWKADEPCSFGIVNHIVKTGDRVFAQCDVVYAYDTTSIRQGCRSLKLV